jgi:alkanesulfonate monooxygenase SsuD/methylene tetrahydromethanopterin reductase-like flavin-dependent oxidoreductase (luciferase family)
MSTSISFVFFRPTAQLTLLALTQAEQAGITSAWVPVIPSAPDPLPLLGAAAVKTSTINLGVAILPLYPRHPLSAAFEALTLAELAPGRFKLGIGASWPFIIEGTFGIPFGKPLGYIREYVTILRKFLWEGAVNFSGEHYCAQAQLPPGAPPPCVPLPVAAIREKMFQLAGEISDGAISSWCPLAFMEKVARPAMRRGAEKANRPTPPLIGAIPTIYSDDFNMVRQIAYGALGMYGAVAGYQEMFQKAGFPLNAQNLPTDDLIKNLFVYGDAATIAKRYQEIRRSGIVDEMLISVYSPNPPADEAAVMQIVKSLPME